MQLWFWLLPGKNQKKQQLKLVTKDLKRFINIFYLATFMTVMDIKKKNIQHTNLV